MVNMDKYKKRLHYAKNNIKYTKQKMYFDMTWNSLQALYNMYWIVIQLDDLRTTDIELWQNGEIYCIALL